VKSVRYSGACPCSGCGGPCISVDDPALGTAFTHDARGVTFTDFPSTTPDITVTYDGNGNKKTVSRGGVNWSYDYNALDQLTREALTMDNQGVEFLHGYDANGHLASRTRVLGPTASYFPDARGRASGIWANGTSYANSAAWHPNGMLASGHFGNGQVFAQSLNPRQLPWALSTTRSGGPTA
jgi:YD repeat-containing protein